VVKIPDGTALQLRFAQAVHGAVRRHLHVTEFSKPGDKIRLVVAEDVRVNGQVAICKGALGQATVIKADPPTENVPPSGDRGAFAAGLLANMLIPQTGVVSIQLDWVEDMTGHQIPLRPVLEVKPDGKAKPKPKSFVMSVESENGGRTARPSKLGADLKGLPRLKAWAPSGTRILAFVDGDAPIDSYELEQAQALLPIRNTTSLLMIYRMKGHGTEQPSLSCDGKELGAIAEKRYTTLELQSGKHVCNVQGKLPTDLTTEAGEEYFLELQHHRLTNTWELKPMTTAEGEDSISGLEEMAANQ
jgi:hypothetical protein